MDQVVVLSDDLSSWTREVQSVGLFGSSKIVQFEDEMLGQLGLIAPDDPSYTCVHEAELVA